jgi:DNA integrity scanning protein DisA with diadenylate cyclase activity
MLQTRKTGKTLRLDQARADGESLMLTKTAFDLARSLGVTKLMVQASEVQDPNRFDAIRGSQQVIWLTRVGTPTRVRINSCDQILELPTATFTRENQLKVGMLLGILNRMIEIDENVICLSGIANSKQMDTLFVANCRRDFPWFKNRTVDELHHLVATREFVSILDIAMRLASEGREGKPIGTSFVLGDEKQLAPHLRQLVLNPCAGHPRHSRDIHDPQFFETIREFAVLDGAFVIDNSGVVQSAGTYLVVPAVKGDFASGLGARHAAARSITEVTAAIAVVVSSSSGTVTVFHEGRLVLELEKPDIRQRRLARNSNRKSTAA